MLTPALTRLIAERIAVSITRHPAFHAALVDSISSPEMTELLNELVGLVGVHAAAPVATPAPGPSPEPAPVVALSQAPAQDPVQDPVLQATVTSEPTILHIPANAGAAASSPSEVAAERSVQYASAPSAVVPESSPAPAALEPRPIAELPTVIEASTAEIPMPAPVEADALSIEPAQTNASNDGAAKAPVSVESVVIPVEVVQRRRRAKSEIAVSLAARQAAVRMLEFGPCTARAVIESTPLEGATWDQAYREICALDDPTALSFTWSEMPTRAEDLLSVNLGAVRKISALLKIDHPESLIGTRSAELVSDELPMPPPHVATQPNAVAPEGPEAATVALPPAAVDADPLSEPHAPIETVGDARLASAFAAHNPEADDAYRARTLLTPAVLSDISHRMRGASPAYTLSDPLADPVLEPLPKLSALEIRGLLTPSVREALRTSSGLIKLGNEIAARPTPKRRGRPPRSSYAKTASGLDSVPDTELVATGDSSPESTAGSALASAGVCTDDGANAPPVPVRETSPTRAPTTPMVYADPLPPEQLSGWMGEGALRADPPQLEETSMNDDPIIGHYDALSKSAAA